MLQHDTYDTFLHIGRIRADIRVCVRTVDMGESVTSVIITPTGDQRSRGQLRGDRPGSRVISVPW
jgi:hypothetical protein